MDNYEELAASIIKNVGGRNNIKNVTNCLTRLRFDLKDSGMVNDSEIAANRGVVTTQFAGGKYQVVIGTQVGDVRQEIERQLGRSGGESSEPADQGGLLDRFIALITQVMTPALNVLLACGVIAGLTAVLNVTGVVGATDGAYLVLNAMGNACLTFFPVILGYTSAKAFGMDPFVGMILGGVLMFPGLTESMTTGDPLFTVFEGSPIAMPVYQTFFGIPIVFPSSGYTSTVLPVVFTTFVASKIERASNRVMPQAARAIMTPVVTILFAGIVSLLIVGPVSIVLGNLISAGINYLAGTVPILAYLVVAIVYQPLVVLGLHWALISVGLVEFATTGSTLIIALIFPASFAHLAVCAAVALRTKSGRIRETALGAVISACFCIIEPSIYGVTLPIKKRFGICMVAGTVGAVIMGFSSSFMYAIAMGVTGFASFINPVTGNLAGLVWCLVSVGATMVVAFLLTWVTYRPDDDGVLEGADNKNASSLDQPARHDRRVVSAPVAGDVRPLSEMSDPAFSRGDMGKGVCIVASEGRVVAPCDGTVTTMFPTGHAVGVTSDDGVEVLVHIGVDTVSLPEGTFEKRVEQGAHVHRGEVLVTFDPQQITSSGRSLETAVLVSNSGDYLDVVPVRDGAVEEGDELLVVIATEPRVAVPAA